jgi:uncharacterized membrane protein YidH (DUF202 family)
MQHFLHGISVTCFVGSYLVAMGLELTRPVVRLPARTVLIAGFTIAGLVSQAVYLVMLARPAQAAGDAGLLADWYSWSLLLSWAVAAAYLILFLRRPDTTIGYFLLPPVLGLVVLALAVDDWEPFDRQRAAGIWRTIHGMSMLIGAAVVLVGFIAGLMYLVQSTRLKHKRRGWSGLKLPTLEWLQRLNRTALVASTLAVAIGTIAGVVMNLNTSGSVAWTSRGIVLPMVLLLWLVVATTVEFFYRPARQGRKISYLTLASFGFLVLAMTGVLGTGHGGTPSGDRDDRDRSPSQPEIDATQSAAPSPRPLSPGGGETIGGVGGGSATGEVTP